MVSPPLLTVGFSRSYAAMASRCFGVTPPTRVRQLNAQVIDLYSDACKTLHYNRGNWTFRLGFLMVRAARISVCSLVMADSPATGWVPFNVT